MTLIEYFPAHCTQISKLIYAAGTIVPFFLTVESDDEQALAILADVSAPDVSIRRKIKSVPGVGDTGGSLILPGSEEEKPIANVVWCNAPGDQLSGSAPNGRTLYGEMKLPSASTLRPSFEFGDFHMKVWVSIYFFLAPRVDEELFTVLHRHVRSADNWLRHGHQAQALPYGRRNLHGTLWGAPSSNLPTRRRCSSRRR